MNTIKQNLTTIEQRIAKITNEFDRDRKDIQLIAVSKTKPNQMIEQAIAAGQYAFAENYVQEGIEKIVYFRKNYAKTPLIWHFIGTLQSNKSKLIAENFDWVHTIDRLKIAKRLSEQRPVTLPPLNVLIQVNIDNEPTKSGMKPDEVYSLAEQIVLLPNLVLRGLMAIPAPIEKNNTPDNAFNKMAHLYQTLKKHLNTVDTLSMGMSQDMAFAIQNGSTMVRIGSAIFGVREYN